MPTTRTKLPPSCIKWDPTIDRMALAICNVVRRNSGLPLLADLSAVESADDYREQAAAAYQVIGDGVK